MSQDKRPRGKTKEKHPIAAILKHLATEGEKSQPDLAEKVPYRTLIRVLQRLEKSGLVVLSSTKRYEFQGGPRNQWKLTFQGVLAALKQEYPLKKDINFNKFTDLFFCQPEYDIIIEKYKDLSLIFRKWSYIKKNPEVRSLLLSDIVEYRSPFAPLDLTEDIDRDLDNLPVFSELRQFEEAEERHFVKTVLQLDHLFSSSAKFELEAPPENRGRIWPVFEYLIKDPEIRAQVYAFIMEEELRAEGVKMVKEKYCFI
ncbi:MAG: hypothetical protein NTV61_11530 [Candidatus Bathyarchaeota archaeon]|nr:hypothetical protein [Candidatus Bathyarchaeota archaeon]